MRKIVAALAAIAAVWIAGSGWAGDIVTARPVGFQLVSVADPQGPALQVGIWYPSTGATASRRIGLASVHVASDGPVDGTRHPLIVISHGNQGAVGSHADTAMALADAGFIVAAPVHTGDNYADQSAVGGPKWFVDRTRHVAAVIDYMLQTWPAHDRIDSGRIGIFGFSAGGTTALISVGGDPDLAGLAARCATVKEFACTLWNGSGPSTLTHDPRIKAAVIVAPGFGFAFLPDGVKYIGVPIQFWNGEADTSVPAASNTVPLRDALGTRAELHLVPGAQHFSFLVPCDGPPICKDAPGFDREAFHKRFNAEVVRFFSTKL